MFVANTLPLAHARVAAAYARGLCICWRNGTDSKWKDTDESEYGYSHTDFVKHGKSPNLSYKRKNSDFCRLWRLSYARHKESPDACCESESGYLMSVASLADCMCEQSRAKLRFRRKPPHHSMIPTREQVQVVQPGNDSSNRGILPFRDLESTPMKCRLDSRYNSRFHQLNTGDIRPNSKWQTPTLAARILTWQRAEGQLGEFVRGIVP